MRQVALAPHAQHGPEPHESLWRHLSLPDPTGRMPATGPCQVFITECLLVGRAKETIGPRQHWELDTMPGIVKGSLWLILDDSQASLHHGARGKGWGTVRERWGVPCA